MARAGVKMTISELEALQTSGKIKGFKAPGEVPADKPQEPKGKIISKHFSRKSKALDTISWTILKWSQEKGLTLMEEYRFHETRKWRFDKALPEVMIAVEFEGGIYIPNGSHKNMDRFHRDTEKYNAATAMGWLVIRLTALNYNSLLTELNACYARRINGDQAPQK